jgi:GT2 family glycosyltransferase
LYNNNFSPHVTIIIPCFNGWSYTCECLNSVYKSSYKNYDVIIVNDGSTDITSISIKKFFPKVKELNGDGNLWWSKSMNLGFIEALSNNSQYVLVLNNDVVINPNTLFNLVNTATLYPNSIVGSIIYNLQKPNIIWSAGGKMKWPWPGEFQLGMGEYDHNQYNGIRNVDWNPGMGTLINTSILKDLNFYDEKNMPQYLSDVDLCLRAKKKGYSILINSECILYNNIENTGGVINNNSSLNFNSIKDMFLSLRSPDFFRARFTFIYRHCNRSVLLFALFIRYFRLLIYILKRIF